jgi:hypothetical protein
MQVADMLGTIQLGKHQKEVVSRLTVLLKDESRDVRITAISALKSIAVAESRRISSTDKYVKYATSLIARYDINRDGVLTKNEWVKTTLNRKTNDDYGRADRDGDGRITPEELGEFLRNR